MLLLKQLVLVVVEVLMDYFVVVDTFAVVVVKVLVLVVETVILIVLVWKCPAKKYHLLLYVHILGY